MSHFTQLFVHDFQAFLHDSLARPGTGRVELAKCIADTLVIKNPPDKEEKIQQVVSARKIEYLLHFTPLNNLRNILRLGFVPRKFLEMSGVKEVIRPLAPDQFRDDGREECFCLSISWPNYKMFFAKRNTMQVDWVVLKINIEAIIQHKCLFFKTNAASPKVRKDGPSNLEGMFYDGGIRHRLGIDDSFTTDPQAEVMSYSRIPPDWIEEIYTDRLTKSMNRELLAISKENLLENGNGKGKIKITQDKTFFGPRKDFSFWKK